MNVYTKITYHQVNILHNTSIIKLHIGPLKSADVGFHLNSSRQDAIGKLIIQRGMLVEQPEIYMFNVVRLLQFHQYCKTYKAPLITYIEWTHNVVLQKHIVCPLSCQAEMPWGLSLAWIIVMSVCTLYQKINGVLTFFAQINAREKLNDFDTMIRVHHLMSMNVVSKFYETMPLQHPLIYRTMKSKWRWMLTLHFALPNVRYWELFY